MSSHLSGLLRQLRRRGYRITPTHSGHLRIFDSCGRLVATVASTPSDPRALANIQAHIRRARKRRNIP